MRRSTKPVLAVTAVATMAFAAACGGSSNTTSSSPDSSAPAASMSSGSGSSGVAGKKVVYVPGLTGNPFYNTVACGAKKAAGSLGMDFAYQGASTFDVSKQTQVVNAVVASKPAAIMISITDPKAMIAPLKAAKAAGIKVIFIDGDVTDTSIGLTNIQSNGVTGGMLAGEALAKSVGYKGDVLAIDNATGSIVSKARTDGFQKAIAKYPKMHWLGIQYSANDISKAANIAATAATSNKNLVGILTAETNNTQGAVTGLKQAGKSDSVKVAGYDTSDPIEADLKNGSLLGTVVQYPYGEGMTGVKDAAMAIQGKSVPRNQGAPFVFATKANLNTPKVQQYLYKLDCSS